MREIIKHWTEADVHKKTWLVTVFFFVILILAFMKEWMRKTCVVI